MVSADDVVSNVREKAQMRPDRPRHESPRPVGHRGNDLEIASLKLSFFGGRPWLPFRIQCRSGS